MKKITDFIVLNFRAILSLCRESSTPSMDLFLRNDPSYLKNLTKKVLNSSRILQGRKIFDEFVSNHTRGAVVRSGGLRYLSGLLDPGLCDVAGAFHFLKMMYMKKKVFNVSMVFLFFILSQSVFSQGVPYGTGSWDRKVFGNQRVVIKVSVDTDVVWVHIPWRRVDENPAAKGIIMVDASSGKIIHNVYCKTINREYGDIAFEPVTGKGMYYLYYLPYKTSGTPYFPNIAYLKPVNQCDAGWLKQLTLNGIPVLPIKSKVATVKRFEAINDFNSFYPMEVSATKQEERVLLEKNAARDFLVFPEDRKHPIRMTDHLPYKWVQEGVLNHFKGVALRNEFYVFQLGIFAAFHPLENVQLSYADLVNEAGDRIPALKMHCFNLRGVDWAGKPFTKVVNVKKGRVQALWIGVDIDSSVSPGIYRGTITVKADGMKSQQIAVALKVLDKNIRNRGYNDLFREARLNWLDSKIGLDDSVFRPYTPVRVNHRTVGILGRTLTFDQYGFPESITSSFTENNDGIDGTQKNVLAGPIKMAAMVNGQSVKWHPQKPKIQERATGAVSWVTTNESKRLSMNVVAKMECDGYINYWVTVTAKKEIDLDDLQLLIPYNKAEATYMMGMGFKGGIRPEKWNWKWKYPNSMIWVGSVNAGLQCKLKNVTPSWDLYDFGKTGFYKDWSNDGKGGCTLEESGQEFLMKAYTGSRVMKPGEKLHFNFGLLITPVKMLDKSHWNERYFQSDPPVDNWLERAAAKGANIINVHQGNVLNPYINYPFISTDTLKRFIARANANKTRTKIYYTIRELSNHVAEIWALRSLGDEVYTEGLGVNLADQFAVNKGAKTPVNTGGSWLVEHLRKNYDPAWHTPLACGKQDMAIRTQGLSRWDNYYLEGLNWLVKHDGIRGIYLDGIGYDREIMKRVRKVLDRASDSCLIDFHSGNSLHPEYGMNSPASQCMELFPYINSLWLGEGYDYNESPDYWLVEVSGIPFGLYSEMLQGCGNEYRGMVYGMSTRLGWTSCDPSAIWKLWDRFNIKDAKMVGYWDPLNPVTSGDPDVKVTVYVQRDSVLVAYASWAKTEVSLNLHVDWKKLGLDPGRVRMKAPFIENFQTEKNYFDLSNLKVPVGGGGIIVIKRQP